MPPPSALCIGGSRGGVRDARPPWASKFFRFHAVFGKIWRVHAPTGGFTPPPRENPGSATAMTISHIKDGHQRRSHRFHISRAPYLAAGSATGKR